MPPAPALLATAWRGPVAEMRVRGHVAVAGADGAVVAALGDPECVTTLRSCVKPLQALPFVRDAAAALGSGDDEVAVACASHDGDTVHVETVRRLLGRAGLDEAQLGCGPQLPFGEAAARRVLREGGGPERVTNNCSGKHSAMLATCRVRQWPL